MPTSVHFIAMVRNLFSLIVFLLMFGSQFCAAQSENAAQRKNTGRQLTSNELSLRSLYHPLEKISFSPERPVTHWLGKEPSTLLVKREGTWNQIDLNTGAETNFEVVKEVAKKLAQLEGVDESDSISAVNAAIPNLKEADNRFIVKIDRGLALASLKESAKWIAKNAEHWRDMSSNSSLSTLAYTKDFNLYVMDLDSGRHLKLTSDGTETTRNGRLDWTYQEEIYGRGNYKGYWLSPDGKWLAMLKIDTRSVPQYTLSASDGERGAGLISRYPKAGDPIPHASLLLWDLRQLKSGRIPKPTTLCQSSPNKERLITGVWWNAHDQTLVYSISDRCQTWREICLVKPTGNRRDGTFQRVIHREQSEAWIEPPSAPSFLQNGNMLWLSEIPSGYSQVYQLSLSTEKPAGPIQSITPEGIHVRSFWIHPDENLLAFLADQSTGTIEQHLYLLSLDHTAPEAEKQIRCVTPHSGWSEPDISPDWNWIVNEHSTAVAPSTLAVLSIDGKETTNLHSGNLQIEAPLHSPKFFAVPTPDGLQLPAALIRPMGTSKEKLPVVVEVYGGPGSPIVTNRWRGTRNLYRELLARQGIATFMIDNRSSAGRGMKDAWGIKGQVGKLELQDLRYGIDWLKKQDWVDPDRILIRGWSFGGFMTISAMTSMSDFRAGIAGGSVTDWKEYDAFYTERYMGLPQQNPTGYQNTAPIHRAEKLHGSLLMIHGEADDNVHPSGTMRMANALQRAGHQFDLMIYPGEAHAIRQANHVWHLAELTDQFIKQTLLSETQ